MKVLIITYYWPPAGGSGVQRWLFFTKYLRDYGIDPVIYTAGGASYPITDDSLKKHIPEGIQVLHGRIWEPGKFLRKKADISDAGFLPENPNIRQKFLHYIRANYFIPDARKFWINPSAKFLIEYLKNHPVAGIISTGPPHSTHLIARKIKRKTGIRWLADFRDPWTDIDYFHKLPLTPVNFARHKRLENNVLTGANVVTVVSEQMRKNYARYNDCRLLTNGYEGVARPPEHYTGSDFILMHAGMLNADRNHPVFWQALSELTEHYPQLKRKLKIVLAGKVSPEARMCIHENNLTDYVEFKDYVPYEQMVELENKAAVLLLFVNRVPGAKGIVTGKVFDYLRSGKPILALAPANGDLARILDDTHAGTAINFNDKKSVYAELKDLYLKFNNRSLIATTSGVEKYSRKTLTGELAAILKEVF